MSEKQLITTCAECCYMRMSPDQRDSYSCRRHTPFVTLVPVQSISGNGLQGITYWPQVQPTDGCGEGIGHDYFKEVEGG